MEPQHRQMGCDTKGHEGKNNRRYACPFVNDVQIAFL